MRKCNCSGNCGPHNLNRREFLGLVGAGAAATLLGSPAWGAFELPADELQRWQRELLAPAKPRLYSSSKHTDARMHLGGIGTGNFETVTPVSRIDEAIKVLQSFLKRHPESRKAHYQLAQYYNQTKMFARAAEEYKAAARLGSALALDELERMVGCPDLAHLAK